MTERRGATPTLQGRIRVWDDPGGLDRIVFFSDAVFAIAMTLLVFSLTVPKGVPPSELGTALAGRGAQFFAFALSFLVIGQYWIVHHRLFRHVERYDLALIWINVVYLLSVCFMPFPSALLGQYFDTPIAGVLYGAALTVSSTLGAVMWRYARGRHLVGTMPDDMDREMTVRALVTPATFALGTAAALIDNGLAVAVWVVVLPLTHLVFTLGIRRQNRR